MKKIVMIFAAMAAVLSSCNKNEIEPVSKNDGKDIVLNISVSNPGADDTKALIKEGWEENDQIQIWFDANTGDTPNLVIKYDGSKWTQEGTVKYVPNEGSGYVKAVYDNKVIVASKDNYSVSGNILTFDIENWTFLTEIQVVVYGDDIDGTKPSDYTLSCDKFTPCTGYNVGESGITATTGTKSASVTGISNDGVDSKPGVAFVFATADYSTSEAAFKFVLTDNTSTPAVKKVYTAKTSKISGTSGSMASIKALTIASSKFAPTTGKAKATIGVSEVDVNWVQLWAGGPKFAEYNVGVTDGKAESYGGYYTWGGTYNNDPNLPDFLWTDDHNTGFSELSHTGEDITDTATNLWSGNWRMPTQAELQGLLDNCDVEWTTVGGKNGRKFTGKIDPYSSNSVFLPAAGYCEWGGDVYGPGSEGYYWSSTPNGSEKAYDLYFSSDNQFMDSYYGDRYYGFSVRAVLKED